MTGTVADFVYHQSNNEEADSVPAIAGPTTLECGNCSSIVGMEDPSTDGWRLLKANVSLNTNATDQDIEVDPWQNHPTEVIIAAQLLEFIERESARRFVVHCGLKRGLLVFPPSTLKEPTLIHIQLWVFNPDLRYSNASAGHSVHAQQAMKVFFQEREDVEQLLHPEAGKVTPLSVEELELPVTLFRELFDTLQRRNQMLPPSARRFNEWHVGLLSRFCRKTRT